MPVVCPGSVCVCVCVWGGGGGGGLLKFRFDRRITEAYFKKWFNRFFLCSGMKLEFLFSTGIK